MRWLLVILLLTGCAHAPQAPVISSAQDYQQQLLQLTHWQLEGKIGVRHAGKSDTVAIQWQQADDSFDIFLSGPLGIGATTLNGTSQHLDIRNGNNTSTTIDDPSHALEQHLGWELPLAKLPHWILGASDNGSARYNADHTLAGFSETDWQVEYTRYDLVEGWLLPSRVTLRHEDLQLTIIITEWKLH